VYEDLFLPSQRGLTPSAEERLAISTQSTLLKKRSLHCWKVH